MTPWIDFDSVLADGIRGFLTHKRALGKRYQSEDEYLRLLDRYLREQSITTLEAITPAVIDAFLISRSYAPRVYNTHIGILRRLFDWLVLQNVLSASPVRARLRPSRTALRPFIFTPDQVRYLLERAAQLPPVRRCCHRGTTYRLAFALMYGLGLRVGEVARLCQGDVDVDRCLLVIRQTKFAKSRWVPLGPKLAGEIATYRQHGDRYRTARPEHPLLSFHRDPRTPILSKSLSRGFHRLVPELDLNVPPDVAYPCAHHLRHSFAVATLLRWYREGINPTDRLIYLSTFLGHVDPNSTAVYLTITAELLAQANGRFERYAAPVLREIRR